MSELIEAHSVLINQLYDIVNNMQERILALEAKQSEVESELYRKSTAYRQNE